MIKNNATLILFLLLWVLQLKAERTAGIAVLLDERENLNLVELQANVFFYSHAFTAKYEKVFIECVVSNKQLMDGLSLKKNTRLFDLKFKKMGKTLADFVPHRVFPFNDTSSVIGLVALIDKASIDIESVPERVLSEMMQKANTNVQMDFFHQYFQRFEFVQQDSVLGYVPYVFQQFNFEKYALEPRLMLVFLHNELIAIFHTRALQVPLYDAHEESLGFGMIYNSKFSEHDKTTLMEVYKSGLHKNK